MDTCSANCLCVCGCGPVITGFCGRLGSSGGHCLLLTASYGLELVEFGNKHGLWFAACCIIWS